MGNSTQRISNKVTNQVKFIPSSSHPHLNSSLIFSFSSHCLCSLSSFLIFIIFFSSLKMPLHHFVFQYIFTSSIHIYINQIALILIFLLFVSPLTQPSLHLFLFLFIYFLFFLILHFCIPAKSLILASIDQNARNGLKFHLRWNRRVVIPVCMLVQDFPTGTKQIP